MDDRTDEMLMLDLGLTFYASLSVNCVSHRAAVDYIKRENRAAVDYSKRENRAAVDYIKRENRAAVDYIKRENMVVERDQGCSG